MQSRKVTKKLTQPSIRIFEWENGNLCIVCLFLVSINGKYLSIKPIKCLHPSNQPVRSKPVFLRFNLDGQISEMLFQMRWWWWHCLCYAAQASGCQKSFWERRAALQLQVTFRSSLSRAPLDAVGAFFHYASAVLWPINPMLSSDDTAAAALLLLF